MKNENIKEFELNTKVLQNFDEIMSMKLDKVEKLIITELDNGSKLLNIISLCANLKTLIIQGDMRINTDRIIRNIFKAETLEEINLKNVKLPKTATLKKCKNLKSICLDSIRGFDIKDLFENGITNKQNIENISITNSDMMNMSIDFLKSFYKLKKLELNNLINCDFNNLSFLKNNKKITKIIIKNNEIPIEEVDNILKYNGLRDIDISVKDYNNMKLTIDENNISELAIIGDKLNIVLKNIDLYQVDRLKILIENGIDDLETVKKLIECKKEIELTVKSYTSLTIEQAELIKEYLDINIINIIENNETEVIEVDEYIINKNQITEIIKQVNYSDNEIQKFLKIYKLLGQIIIFSDNKKTESKILCEKKEVAKILQRCLECVNVESNIIFGDNLETEEDHCWNQVKIDNKWYNVDLALDVPNIKKKKTEYCLLDDEDFSESHSAKFGQKHDCLEEYNYKFVNVYIKTGLFKTQLLASYIEIMKLKFKKIFNSNKKEKILALPSGENDENKNISAPG